MRFNGLLYKLLLFLYLQNYIMNEFEEKLKKEKYDIKR